MGGFLPQLPSARSADTLHLGLGSVLLTDGGRGLSEAPFWLPGHLRGRGECALGRWVAWLLSPAHTGSPVPQPLPHGAGELWGSESAVGPESAFPHILGPGRLAGFLLVSPGDDT